VSLSSTLFYEELVLIPEYKFQEGEHAPEPWDDNYKIQRLTFHHPELHHS
jgi:hypothetical protein